MDPSLKTDEAVTDSEQELLHDEQRWTADPTLE